MLDLLQSAKETLTIEAAEILDCAQNLDESFVAVVKEISALSGKLIVIGVGKSGLVGAKIAATMASTGTPSFFIHPTDAMHGDMGMICKNDGVLAISYSGESSELLQILPHIKRLGIPLFAMSESHNTSLASFADIHLSIRVNKEACPFNAAPTSSTTVTMALGDALAIALMKEKGFKKEDFAFFHPGGTLGKRLFVKAKDLMRSNNLPIVSRETSLKEAIIVMSEGKLGSVLIAENNSLLAVLSDGDLRRALMGNDFSIEKQAFAYATKNPKICKNPDILAAEALNLIEEAKIQLLVITNEQNEIIGVLHIHDLIEAGIKP